MEQEQESNIFNDIVTNLGIQGVIKALTGSGGVPSAPELISATPAGGETVTAAAPSFLGNLFSSTFPSGGAGLGITAGAITGGLQASGVKSAFDGDKLSTGEQAALALPTFGASFLFNPVKSLFSGEKSKERKDRQGLRKVIQGIYGTGNDTNITRKDGGSFDIGSDGAFNVDFSNPLASKAVALLNPAGEVITKGDDKRRSDVVGMLTNLALEGATTDREVFNNILETYREGNLNSVGGLTNRLTELKNQGLLTQDEFDVAIGSVGTLSGGR